jgi:hypothetical protein
MIKQINAITSSNSPIRARVSPDSPYPKYQASRDTIDPCKLLNIYQLLAPVNELTPLK